MRGILAVAFFVLAMPLARAQAPFVPKVEPFLELPDREPPTFAHCDARRVIHFLLPLPDGTEYVTQAPGEAAKRWTRAGVTTRRLARELPIAWSVLGGSAQEVVLHDLRVPAEPRDRDIVSRVFKLETQTSLRGAQRFVGLVRDPKQPGKLLRRQLILLHETGALVEYDGDGEVVAVGPRGAWLGIARKDEKGWKLGLWDPKTGEEKASPLPWNGIADDAAPADTVDRFPFRIESTRTYVEGVGGTKVIFTLQISVAGGLEKIPVFSAEGLFGRYTTLGQCGDDELVFGGGHGDQYGVFRASLSELLLPPGTKTDRKEIPKLIEQLVTHAAPAVAWRAAVRLRALGIGEAEIAAEEKKWSGKPELKKPVAALIAALGDDVFEVREAASKELGALITAGPVLWASRDLRAELEKARKAEDLEVRQRVERMLPAWEARFGAGFAGEAAMKARRAYVTGRPISPAPSALARRDVAKVTSSLNELIKRVVVKDEYVEWLWPEFDATYSDLRRERLRYSSRGRMKTAPWHDGKTTVRNQVTLRVDRGWPQARVRAESRSEIATDVLGGFRYTAQRYLDTEKGSLPEPVADHVAWLEKMTKVDSLGELAEKLEAGRKLHIESLERVIADEKKTGRRSADPSSSMLRRALLRLRFEVSDDKKTISFRHLEATGFLPANTGRDHVDEVSLALTDKLLTVSVLGSWLLSDTELERLTKDLDRLAGDLEPNDPKRTVDMEKTFLDALEKFRDALKKK